MKISLNWLGQYVNLQGLAIEHIVDQLTMKTAEVEEVHPLKPCLEGVVVARVLEVAPLDDGLSLASLDLGQLGRRQCASRAENLRPDMYSVFACPGSRISNGSVIEQTVIQGHNSQGMLLSPLELGISQYQDGVMDLPTHVSGQLLLKPGQDLREVMPGQDYIIEIDNKSLTHRPDLWGHYGFARELAAIFKRPLQPLNLWNVQDLSNLPAYALKIDDETLCPGYACLAIDNINPVPSPLFMQLHLYSVGLRAINLLVDLTNYLMLEIGQPMHAFDGDFVQSIRVATMGRDDATFTTLDGQERKMLNTDLMIWNQDKPIGIAGVMGGLQSEVSAKTRRIVLESANFQPMTIRRTAMRLNLRTDASARFEKDLPKSFMGLAIARFLKLCYEAGQPPVPRSRLTVAGQAEDRKTVISMPDSFISRYVGEDVPPSLIKETLTALEFGVQFSHRQLKVVVPPHRSRRDISIPQDIVEEVARFYGYDNITPRLPKVDITPYRFNLLSLAEHKLRRLYSQGHNALEAHSYSWYDDRWLERLGYAPPASCLTLANPIAPYKARLRQGLVPNLLEFVHNNYDQYNELNLYEIGHCYWPKGEKESDERTLVTMIMYKAGPVSELESMLAAIKGVLADSMAILNIADFQLQKRDNDLAPWALANSSLDINFQGRIIGSLGYLTGQINEAFKQNARLVWLQFELEPLAGPAFPEVDFAMPSQYPNSWLDITLLWPTAKDFGALEARLDEFSHELIQRRKFLTYYAGKGLPQGMRSYSFRYWIGLDNRTLSKDDIEGFRNQLMAFLAEHKIEMR